MQDLLFEAQQAAKKNKIALWIEKYLKGSRENKALLGRIRKLSRCYWVGPISFELNKLKRCCGPEPELPFCEPKQKWERRIKVLVCLLNQGWQPEPIIVTNVFKGYLTVSDGNHRYEALLRKGIKKYWTLFFFSNKNDRDYFVKHNTVQLRCEWPSGDELMIEYHDQEWGVPVHNDRKHFEFLLLDAFQAGLSWRTILHKRENFRRAFSGFDYKKIAKYDKQKINHLLKDQGIIRNRLKIYGAVKNAQAFIQVQKEFGSFDKYVWQFVNNKTIKNKFKSLKDIPATSKESDAMSKDLKKRGFTFIGSTICYAYMQAAGLVNDHIVSCFRYNKLK